MKIINKIREWNTLNKIIVYLLCLPLFLFVGMISGLLVGLIIEFFIPISALVALKFGTETGVILWIIFGFKFFTIFRKNKGE